MALSSTPPTGGATTQMMPGNVRAVHVVSVLDEIGELGPGAHVNRLAEKIDADLASLLPILNAAEMLGLLRSEKGNLFLTDDGQRFQETDIVHVLALIRDRLTSIEPFHTAIELASRRGSTTAGEVAETLDKLGIEWDYRPETNEALVKSLLIYWGLRAGLLAYDGKKGKFWNAVSP